MLATRPTSSDLFRAFDIDKSGGIDGSELARALSELGLPTDERQTLAILQQYDLDKSGVLEQHEFDVLVNKLIDFQQCKSKACEQPRDRTAEIFAAFDVNSSYTLGPAELLAALNTLGLPAHSEHARMILRKYDVDGNGRLDANEFRKLVGDLRSYHDHRRRSDMRLV